MLAALVGLILRASIARVAFPPGGGRGIAQQVRRNEYWHTTSGWAKCLSLLHIPSQQDGTNMSNGDLGWITNFIWGVADDVLRDLYVRDKYRDVILPMTVLRRLDAVLEPTKPAVLDMKVSLDKAHVMNQDAALRQAANQAFYNASRFTLRDLSSRTSQQQLRADFEAYLDGFSPNVQDILDNFEFRNQIPRLSRADALGSLIEKLLDPTINLGPNPVLNGDGSEKQPGLDNHAMGTIFE